MKSDITDDIYMNLRREHDQITGQTSPVSPAVSTRVSGVRSSYGGQSLALREWWNRQTPEYVPIAVKLASIFALLIALGMVGLGFVIGAKQSGQLGEQIDKFGTTLVQRMAEMALEPLLANDQLNMEQITNTLAEDTNIDGAAIFSDELVPLAQAGHIPDILGSLDRTAISQNTPKQINWQIAKDKPGSRAFVSFVTPINFQDITLGYVLLSFDHSVMTEAKRDTFVTVIVVTLLMLATATVASFYLGRRLTRPIDQLLVASNAYSEGEYHYRIHDNRKDELGVLMKSFNVMGEGLLRNQQVEQAFSRYVSPQVAHQAISDLDTTQPQLGGKHVEASVLFADIVGFTSMSEEMSPEGVSQLLNLYFSNIAEAVRFCRGHIDKYIGDCAMIVFGVPIEDDQHPFNAVTCGWMILQMVKVMNRQRILKGEGAVEFRIGVNSGTMLAGNMGSAERMEYTVVGDAVNLASRLSHAGEPGQLVLMEEMLTHPALKKRISIHDLGTIKIRGKKEPSTLYMVKEIDDAFREEMMQEIRRILVRSTTGAV